MFCTHGWMTSRVACHHCLLTAHMSRKHRAWRAIIILGLDTRSNDVERGMASSRWIAHMVLDDVGLGITSSTLDSTHGRTMLGFACNHHPWTAHIVGLRRARHAIIALGKNTRSVDLGGMLSSPLDCTYTWTMLGATMVSSPLGSTHGRMMSGIKCHH